MKLETKEEKDAFEFICKLASERTDRICNDLENKDSEKFKSVKVEADGIFRQIQYDFDVIHWLKSQVK